jgi:transposase-like protein
MKATRKRYSGEFEAQVVLEALRGDLTLAELGAKDGIHHTMIAGAGWTMCSSNGFGDPSTTSASTCMPSRQDRSCASG